MRNKRTRVTPREIPLPRASAPGQPSGSGEHILRIFAAGLSFYGSSPAARADPAYWISPLSGEWSDGLRWSSTPDAPNNVGGGTTYDATVNETGEAYSILLGTDTTLDNLTLNSGTATIRGTALLEVLHTATLTQGTYYLDGGTIRGGTWNVSADASLAIGADFDSLLDGVIINGALTLEEDYAVTRVSGGTTFTNANLTGYGSYLAFAPDQTLTGEILFGGAESGERGVEMAGSDGTFTISETGVIRTAADLANFDYNVIGYGYDGGEMSLINAGLISAETLHQQIMVDTLSLENSGTIQAVNGGFFTIGTDSFTNDGQLLADTGGILAVGSFTATNSGTIQAKGAVVVVSADSVTNSGVMEALDSGALAVDGGTLVNSGILRATNGSLLDLYGDVWSNGGTIELDGTSTLNLGGVFDVTGGLGVFKNPDGGTVNITGTLLNTAHTLTLDNTTGSWTLDGGSLQGGVVTFAHGKSLSATSNPANLLDGVTINGDLTLAADEAVAGIQGGAGFQTAHLSGADSSLLFAPDQTLTGTVLFEGATTGERGVGMNGEDGLFIIGTGGLIRTAADLENGFTNRIGNAFGSAGVMSLQNEGLISSETDGQLISLEPGAMINAGTIQALNGGTLRLGTALANYVSLTGTLTGGIWAVETDGPVTTLELNQGGDIVVNNAEVRLSGPNSVFPEMEALSENQGIFTLANGRIFSTAGALTNSGTISIAGTATELNLAAGFTHTNTGGGLVNLAGGRLAGESISNEGAISGFGTVTGRPVNHGGIRASGGTLVFEAGIQGGSGTVEIDPGAALDLSGGALGSSADFLIHNGGAPGSLNLGANDFTVEADYTNSGTGSGNSYQPRANISGSGQILAGGDVAQELEGDVTNGGTAAPLLDFGNVHVGDTSTLNYRIANSGATGPALRGAVRTAGAGGNITDPRLTGGGVTPGNFGPITAGTDAGDLAVTFNANTAGALTGQSVGIVNNFDNVTDQTLAVTGAAYRFASPGLPGGTAVNFGIVHVGDIVSQSVSVANDAVNDGFSESLSASFSGATAGITTGGSVVLLGPGAAGGSVAVGLDTSVAGNFSGTANLAFVSDGAGSSGLGETALAVQAVDVTGQVNHYAVPLFVLQSGPGSLTQNGTTVFTLDLGTISSLDPAPVLTLGLTNDVPGAAPSDTLAGAFLSELNSFTAGGFVPFSGVAGGQTLGGMTISLDNSWNGVFSGTITLSADSRNSGGYNGSLGDYVINLQAIVVPEPSVSVLLLILGATVCPGRRSKQPI